MLSQKKDGLIDDLISHLTSEGHILTSKPTEIDLNKYSPMQRKKAESESDSDEYIDATKIRQDGVLYLVDEDTGDVYDGKTEKILRNLTWSRVKGVRTVEAKKAEEDEKARKGVLTETLTKIRDKKRANEKETAQAKAELDTLRKKAEAKKAEAKVKEAEARAKEAWSLFRKPEARDADARANVNLMPGILEACEQYATLGEIADTFRNVFGEYRPN
jgi:hypothetical protein